MKTQFKKISKKYFFWLSIAVFGLMFNFFIQDANAYTVPDQAAPYSNVGAPLTTGSLKQNKSGGLGAAQFCLPGADGLLGTADDSCQAGAQWSGGSGGSWGTTPVSCYQEGGNMGWHGCDDGYVLTALYLEPGPSWGRVQTMKCCRYFSTGGSTLVNGGGTYGHTEGSCTSAGGTVVSNFCKFSRSSCPSKWTQAENWTTTTSNHCSGTGGGSIDAPDSGCGWQDCGSGYTYCCLNPAHTETCTSSGGRNSGSHAFANTAPENNTAYYSTPHDGEWSCSNIDLWNCGYGSPYCAGATQDCRATVTEIGCY